MAIRRRSKARLIAKLFRTQAATGDEEEKAVLKSENTEAVRTIRSSTTDSNSAVIDTFKGTDIRAAHYYITAHSLADSHQAQQIYVTHDGNTATMTTYGTLVHASDTIVTYDVDIDSSDTISLSADPQISGKLDFSFERVDVKKV